MDLHLRALAFLVVALALPWLVTASHPVVADEIACDQCFEAGLMCDGSCNMGLGQNGPHRTIVNEYGPDGTPDLSWLNQVRVGYDNGFLIASKEDLNLQVSRYPFRIRLNGWGQLRHTLSDVRQIQLTPTSAPNRDLNQFQLKRGRLVFSGSAFNPDFSYFVQLDGRSSSGDDFRLLDYFLSYDLGHAQFGLKPGTFGFRTGKYKMPFTMARWLSGREFEFPDRSVSSTFFDVNRSLAWGLYGQAEAFGKPLVWETALFNGLVTGGAETGSSGTLDDNFAWSTRVYGYPIGDWGTGSLTDFDWHESLAMRVGFGIALSEIDRIGTTEFSRLLVVDSGERLSDLLPATVSSYSVNLYAMDASIKYRGWSATLEYYFRTVGDFSGPVAVNDTFDHGFWLQFGYFLIPRKFQVLTRWSRVEGNSGTLGVSDQSSDEFAGAIAWYFRDNHAKFVADITRLNGAPINSAALDVAPSDDGWLLRSQIQFSF
ncbi:MAG: hypothetical protein AAGG48_05465 [Planctomycetota bacterium]